MATGMPFDGGIWQVERMESLCTRQCLQLSFVLDKIWAGFTYELERHAGLLTCSTSWYNMPIAVRLAISQFISSTGLGVHPAVTPRKSMPYAKGCIYGRVSAGHLSNYSNIHGWGTSLTSVDLLSKLMPCCCLTSEPMSHSVGSLHWRWFLVKDMGPQGGEDLGLLIPLW